MNEQQRSNMESSTGPTASPARDNSIVRVESIDGDVVEVSASGSETVSEIRQMALEGLGAVTDNPEKYLVISAEGRVVEEGTRLSQLISEGQSLEFQLLPQATFGKRQGVASKSCLILY